MAYGTDGRMKFEILFACIAKVGANLFAYEAVGREDEVEERC